MYEYDITEKLDNKMQEYKKVFKEGFGIDSVAGLTEDEVIKVIDDCIARGKKVEYEDMGYSQKEANLIRTGKMRI